MPMELVDVDKWHLTIIKNYMECAVMECKNINIQIRNQIFDKLTLLISNQIHFDPHENFRKFSLRNSCFFLNFWPTVPLGHFHIFLLYPLKFLFILFLTGRLVKGHYNFQCIQLKTLMKGIFLRILYLRD